MRDAAGTSFAVIGLPLQLQYGPSGCSMVAPVTAGTIFGGCGLRGALTNQEQGLIVFPFILERRKLANTY